MTRLKSSEPNRPHSDRLESLGRLSAGLAHEINNPLGLILGYTQLMLKEAKPGDRFHEDLKMVEKHARNCKIIVEDLLRFSGAVKTSKTLSDLNELVKEAVSVVQSRFGTKKLLIVKKLARSLPGASVDREKIKQVFVNILTNAGQALEGKGKITVSTSCDERGGRIVVCISDTGSGIAPEIIEKVFDPFFTTRSTGRGRGLGLAVSYGIIRNHGGEINVKSPSGKGSTFTVLLPFCKAGAHN